MNQLDSNTPFVDDADKVQMAVKFITPNTVLACPVFDKDGNIIHDAYEPFTEDVISNLLAKNIDHIYYAKKSRKVEAIYAKNLNEYLEKNIYKGPRAISLETQKKAINLSQKIEKTVKDNQPIHFLGEVGDLVQNVIRDVNLAGAEIINLLSIQSFDDFTYSHSLNVGIIAMMLAKKLDFSDELVKEIGIASFLHDMGKIRLPYDIINKSGPLTPEEFDIIKKHPRYGFELVKKSTELSNRVKNIILLHHEKHDGTGYPFGIQGNMIEDHVVIVSMAEFYDALTTELPYKQSFSSKDAMAHIIRNSGTHFKPELAHRISNISTNLFKENDYYLVGSFVQLNTEEIAKVISKDHDLTSRPVIEIIKNNKGDNLSRPIVINLHNDNSRYIDRIINTN